MTKYVLRSQELNVHALWHRALWGPCTITKINAEHQAQNQRAMPASIPNATGCLSIF